MWNLFRKQYTYRVSYTDNTSGGATEIESDHPIDKTEAAGILKEQLEANSIYVAWLKIDSLVRV